MSDEQAVREVIAAWLAATRGGDLDKVLSLMTDDAVFLRAGQPPMRGKDEFAASFKSVGDAKIDARSEIREVAVDGRLAYCWSRLTVTFTPPGGEPKKREGEILSVFRKEADGRWRLHRDANLLS